MCEKKNLALTSTEKKESAERKSSSPPLPSDNEMVAPLSPVASGRRPARKDGLSGQYSVTANAHTFYTLTSEEAPYILKIIWYLCQSVSAISFIILKLKSGNYRLPVVRSRYLNKSYREHR